MLKVLRAHKSILDFFVASLILCILYRGIFFIYTNPTSFESNNYRLTILSFGLVSDFTICLLIASILFVIKSAAYSCVSSTVVKKIIEISINSFLIFIFLIFTLTAIIHQKLFALLFRGLNYTFLLTAYHQGLSSFNFITFATTSDFILLFSVFIIYLIIKNCSLQCVKKILIYILIPIYSILTLYGATLYSAYHITKPYYRITSMFLNPVITIIVEFIDSFNDFNRAKMNIDSKQLHSIQLNDQSFLSNYPSEIIQTFPIKSDKMSWNIVLFVLESVNTKFIFNNTNQYPMPMPFLKRLAEQGLWFKNHYSSGNISALGQFSIFTGLYPNPLPCHFEMQANLNIPSIANWLGKQYDSFFISSGNDFYAPIGLNKTFSEYINATMINPPNKKLFFNTFLDENIAFNFFLKRLNKAKYPFLAVYWSDATHFPYLDYSQQAHIAADISKPFNRYLNGLNVLDSEIKKIYDQLRNNNQLDHTIFIIVGDHGEIFQEHENYHYHGATLFQEEIKVPLVIYAPKLFKPQIINQVTSSISILPTLLSALNIPYGTQLQGQSLLSKNRLHQYVFVYGDHDELAAIGYNQQKMIISFSNNTCTSYDLNLDPHEQHPLSCLDARQKEAILKFRNFQPQILKQIKEQARTDFSTSNIDVSQRKQ